MPNTPTPNQQAHHGAPLSMGMAQGRVAIIHGSPLTYVKEEGLKGEKFVFVASYGDPDLTVLCPHAAAFITEVGGGTSHLASVCREYDIPYMRLEKAKSFLVQHQHVAVIVQPGSATVYTGD